MVLGSEGIWTKEFSTGPGHGVCVDEAQKYHHQAGCMPQQVEGNQVVYQCWYPVVPYQGVILSNNQVEGSLK